MSEYMVNPQAIAGRAQDAIDGIEQMVRDLALIGQASLLTPAQARAMCAQLDDVVTGLAHKATPCASGLASCDDCGLYDGCDGQGEPKPELLAALVRKPDGGQN